MMATSAARAADPSDRELTTGGIWKGAMLGAAGAAAGNVVLYLVAGAAGVSLVGEFMKGQAPIPMPLPPVVIATFVPAIAAALLATLLNRFTAKPAKIFLGVAGAFGLFSMMGPATIGGAGTGLRVVLALMHVMAGIGIASGILRFGKR